MVTLVTMYNIFKFNNILYIYTHYLRSVPVSMKRSRSGDFAGFKTVTVWLPFGYQDFLTEFLAELQKYLRIKEDYKIYRQWQNGDFDCKYDIYFW